MNNKYLISTADGSYIDVASLLSQTAGLAHDLGKATVLFQTKLSGGERVSDAVRHEWVSAAVLAKARLGYSDINALFTLSERDLLMPIEKKVSSAQSAVSFIVATHHKLLGSSEGAVSKLNNRLHRQHDKDGNSVYFDTDTLKPARAFTSGDGLIKKVLNNEQRLAAMTETVGPLFWRAIAPLARASVIMADHVVSAEDISSRATKQALFANTVSTTTGKSRLNQPLDWHLAHVGKQAGRYAREMLTMALPGLSQYAVEQIVARSSDARFAWQDRAVDALTVFRDDGQKPMLLFNVAGTGAGKTRMNAKAACSLSMDPQRVRFCTALNLRTLTLQTGDAFRHDFGLSDADYACLIGDTLTKQLHEGRRSNDETEDGLDCDIDYQATGDFVVPGWLRAFAQGKRYFNSVVAAPVLVSTIDFIIAAGEPHRQGHHVAALLRLLDSDLILDEVDSYDTKARVALMRLITMSALCGRNVICSTATLPKGDATEIAQAYALGARLRADLCGFTSPQYSYGLIDDRLAPEIVAGDLEVFTNSYQRRLDEIGQLPISKEKKPVLVNVDSLASWGRDLSQAALAFHSDHHSKLLGKRISFGLIRMANVKPAVDTAMALCQLMPNAQVCCYHSQDYLIRRSEKEAVLDGVLNRKKGLDHLLEHPDIVKRIEQTESEDVLFIVVATPVEEVGRDHDFDWALVDVSSGNSLVQIAGRVNRHRREIVSKPNIGVVQFNYRHLSHGDSKPAFIYPGFETADYGLYPSHDLKVLLDWDKLAYLSPTLLTDKHLLVSHEGQSVQQAIRRSRPLFYPEKKGFESAWMGKAIYANYPLRDKSTRLQIRYTDSVGTEVLTNEGFSDQRWLARHSERITLPANAWLAWEEEALVERCKQRGIRADEGLSLSVPDYRKENVVASDLGFKRSGFGFYSE